MKGAGASWSLRVGRITRCDWLRITGQPNFAFRAPPLFTLRVWPVVPKRLLCSFVHTVCAALFKLRVWLSERSPPQSYSDAAFVHTAAALCSHCVWGSHRFAPTARQRHHGHVRLRVDVHEEAVRARASEASTHHSRETRFARACPVPLPSTFAHTLTRARFVPRL